MFILGPRRIDKVLEYASSQLIKDTRQLVPKIVLLLTAGRPSSAQSLKVAAQPLHEHGAKMYVVTIGDKPDVNDFLPIVKDETFVIKVRSFDVLSRRALPVAQQLAKQSGKIIVTTPL